jgi:hypothetical protein
MSYLYLGAFVAGLLLAVRIMFFGAERRRVRFTDAMPLRRSEPAVVAFLVMFGVAGYLLTRHRTVSSVTGGVTALTLGVLWAALVTRIAVAMARVQPEHDHAGAHFLLQGHVAIVTTAIPAHGEGTIAYDEATSRRTLRARSLHDQAVDAGREVCIERVDDGVALVELWSLVEARL